MPQQQTIGHRHPIGKEQHHFQLDKKWTCRQACPLAFIKEKKTLIRQKNLPN